MLIVGDIMKKISIILLLIFLLLIGFPYDYYKTKLYLTKKTVESYLIDKGINEKNIQDMKPYYSWKQGGIEAWGVRVKFKNDKGYYFYVRSNNVVKVQFATVRFRFSNIL